MAFCKNYLDITSIVKIVWPFPFSLSTFLNAHMKDNGLFKTIIPLGMDFNFKTTVVFYVIICMHQFEHNGS